MTAEATPLATETPAEPTFGDALLAAHAAETAEAAPANDEAAPAAAEEEPAKPEPAPEPPKPKDTALFRSALKAREEARRLHAEATQAKARVESELAKERAELAKERELYAAIKADPLAYFEKLGVDPNDFARLLLKHGESKPEEREAKKQLETMAERIERLEKEKAEALERAEVERIERNVQGAKQSFITHLEAHAEKYPDVAMMDPAQASALFWDLAGQHFDNTGNPPTFDMVAAHIQREAEAASARKEARRQQLLGAKTPATSQAAAPQRAAAPPTATGATQRSSTTLTNVASATRATPPREMTEDEMREEHLALLRKALG